MAGKRSTLKIPKFHRARESHSPHTTVAAVATTTTISSTTPLGLSKKGCVCVCHLRIQLGNLGSLLLTGSITEALRDPCKLPLFGSWSSLPLPSSRPTGTAARAPCVLYVLCLCPCVICAYQQKKTPSGWMRSCDDDTFPLR